MTTYYIRKTGNDNNDGQTALAAFATIAKAESMVAPGDKVIVGPGWWREMHTAGVSGTNGNPIIFEGDILGQYTGDTPGEVVFTGSNEQGSLTRLNCLNFTSVTFRQWKNIVFGFSQYTPVYSTPATNPQSLEGVEFHRCTFITYSGNPAMFIDYNTGLAPATTGLVCRWCTFAGGMSVDFDSNASAHVNVGVLLDHCFLTARWGNLTGAVVITKLGFNAYTIGGFTIRNSLIIFGYNTIENNGISANSAKLVLENCILGGAASTAVVTSITGNTVLRRCVLVGNATPGAAVVQELSDNRRREWLPSMFLPGIEPIFARAGIRKPPLSPAPGGSFENFPVYPLYNSMAMDAGGENIGNISRRSIMLNGPTADPNNMWVSDSNLADMALSTAAGGSANGSATANYIAVTGSTDGGSDTIGTVYSVTAHIFVHVAGGSAVMGATFYVGVEAVGSATGQAITDVEATNPGWVEVLLNAPAAGWNYTNLKTVEARLYKESGAGTLFAHAVMLVARCSTGTHAIGPGDVIAYPKRSTAQAHTGSSSAELQGHSTVVRMLQLESSVYTVSVWARRNTAYAGTAPTIEVRDVLDDSLLASATAAGGADTWEHLTCTYNAPSAKLVRVVMRSTSERTDGLCWFDDLLVEAS
jgi:hypothetical protein